MPLSEIPTKAIAGYELLTAIGVGGMGTVYAARKEVVDGVSRMFALKLLHPQLRESDQVHADLLDEARMTAWVQHPNVVKMVEAVDSSEGLAS